MYTDPAAAQRFAAFAKAVQAIMDGDVDDGGIVDGPDGTPLRVLKRPEPGVELRAEPVTEGGDSFTMTVWEAAPQRPAGYPADLPFVPDIPVSLASWAAKGRSGRQIHWEDVDGAQAVASQIVEQSLSDEWEAPGSEGPFAPPGMDITHLTRRGASRLIMTHGAPSAAVATIVMIETAG